MSKFYDVILVGGGIVGLSFAAALKKNPLTKSLSLLMLERASKPTFPLITADLNMKKVRNRVVALSPRSKDFFKSLGIWSQLELAGRIGEIDSMRIGDRKSNGFVSFHSSLENQRLAYVVENHLLEAHLYHHVKDSLDMDFSCPDLSVKMPAKRDLLTKPIKLLLSNGEGDLNCRLLVGADGLRSQVRSWIQTSTSSADLRWTRADDKAALVANIYLEEDHHSVAWQRFLSCGPIAFLPLADKRQASLVWSCDLKEGKRLAALNDQDFIRELNKMMQQNESSSRSSSPLSYLLSSSLGITSRQVEWSPPAVIDLQSDSRAMFPIGFSLASQIIGPRSAIIGDAAHRILPLAGQGVNLGIGDVCSLVDTLSSCVQHGADIGDPDYLEDFQTDRFRDVLPMAACVEALHCVFSFESPLLVGLREVGMCLFNSLEPIKDAAISVASGRRNIIGGKSAGA